MADSYIHGIVIKEGTGEVRAIRSPSPYVIGLIGTAPGSKDLMVEVPAVFFKKKTALDAVFPLDAKGDKGTLYDAATGVYDQADATVILIRSKSGSDQDVMAAIEKLADAESTTGYKPKIIASPGFGNLVVQPSQGPTPSPTPTPTPDPAPDNPPDEPLNTARGRSGTNSKNRIGNGEVGNG